MEHSVLWFLLFNSMIMLGAVWYQKVYRTNSAKHRHKHLYKYSPVPGSPRSECQSPPPRELSLQLKEDLVVHRTDSLVDPETPNTPHTPHTPHPIIDTTSDEDGLPWQIV